MNYRGIKVLFISPVVYLGEEFKNNHWKDNEKLFKNRIKNLNFMFGIKWECPIEDLIMLSVDYEDDLDPIIKIDTLIKIFNTVNELLKVFDKDKVKMNLYLDNCDSIDMTVVEFIGWLYKNGQLNIPVCYLCLFQADENGELKEMSDTMKKVIKEKNTISEYKKTQEMMKKLAVELSEMHKSAVEDWQNGEIEKIWFDHNGNLCIEYTSGNWWHYNEKGEWR